MKKISILASIAAVIALSMVTATSAFASSPERIDGFVCPVLGGQAGGEHGSSAPEPIVGIGGGDSSVIGPEVSIPMHATNDDGAGTPGDAHASPGDDGYTAIWAD